MNKDCFNVSRGNHILRVHGHALATETGCLGAVDDGARKEQEMVFPCLTKESFVQAALGPKVGGLGWRTAMGTASAAKV